MPKHPLVYCSSGWAPAQNHGSHEYNGRTRTLTINAFEDIEVPIDHPDYVKLVQRRLIKGIHSVLLPTNRRGSLVRR